MKAPAHPFGPLAELRSSGRHHCAAGDPPDLWHSCLEPACRLGLQLGLQAAQRARGHRQACMPVNSTTNQTAPTEGPFTTRSSCAVLRLRRGGAGGGPIDNTVRQAATACGGSGHDAGGEEPCLVEEELCSVGVGPATLRTGPGAGLGGSGRGLIVSTRARLTDSNARRQHGGNKIVMGAPHPHPGRIRAHRQRCRQSSCQMRPWLPAAGRRTPPWLQLGARWVGGSVTIT